jgi:aminoglycoside 6'-N-acetyltransferase I
MITVLPYSDSYEKKYKNIVRLLWNDVTESDLQTMVDMHKRGKEYILLAIVQEEVVGFLNSSIRSDYVEGSDEEQTGYIEGIFVLEEYRKQSVATKLLDQLVIYYKERHISSIGSDAFVDNQLSDYFHKALGFKEVSINRHYILKI